MSHFTIVIMANIKPNSFITCAFSNLFSLSKAFCSINCSSLNSHSKESNDCTLVCRLLKILLSSSVCKNIYHSIITNINILFAFHGYIQLKNIIYINLSIANITYSIFDCNNTDSKTTGTVRLADNQCEYQKDTHYKCHCVGAYLIRILGRVIFIKCMCLMIPKKSIYSRGNIV